MKKIIIFFCIFSIKFIAANAQDDVYPTPEHKGLLLITNATIHTGTGEVIENGTIEVRDGKISRVGKDIPASANDAKIIDAKGKHVYPGLILSSSTLWVGGDFKLPTADAERNYESNPSMRSISL
jgi:imidazolonepropionase-like amidohydrolase